MQQGKCQLCLRRLRLNLSGEVVSHHKRGDHCLGSGFAPIEMDDQRLAEIAKIERQRASAIALKIRKQIDMRANRIEPELIREQCEASSEAHRLEVRLARLNNWPERFARQMETQGYGEPPPAYITERRSQQITAREF